MIHSYIHTLRVEMGRRRRKWNGRSEAEYCEMLSAQSATLRMEDRKKLYTKVTKREDTKCIYRYSITNSMDCLELNPLFNDYFNALGRNTDKRYLKTNTFSQDCLHSRHKPIHLNLLPPLRKVFPFTAIPPTRHHRHGQQQRRRVRKIRCRHS